jgi:hypothetical protein
MTIQIPKAPTEVNAEWLNSVLCEGNHIGASRVTEIETAIAATQGTTSTLLRVKIVLDNAVSMAIIAIELLVVGCHDGTLP